MVCLFVFCPIIFPNTYYSVNPRYLSFKENLDNFEGHLEGLDVYEDLVRELGLCNANVVSIREPIAKPKEETKLKFVYVKG